MPPFGSFALDCGETARRTYYFFAAGSGITPLYSMLASVMVAERRARDFSPLETTRPSLRMRAWVISVDGQTRE